MIYVIKGLIVWERKITCLTLRGMGIGLQDRGMDSFVVENPVLVERLQPSSGKVNTASNVCAIEMHVYGCLKLFLQKQGRQRFLPCKHSELWVASHVGIPPPQIFPRPACWLYEQSLAQQTTGWHYTTLESVEETHISNMASNMYATNLLFHFLQWHFTVWTFGLISSTELATSASSAMGTFEVWALWP